MYPTVYLQKLSKIRRIFVIKKKRAPKRTAVQKAAIRPKCRKLVVIFRKKAIIMDDE